MIILHHNKLDEYLLCLKTEENDIKCDNIKTESNIKSAKKAPQTTAKLLSFM